MINVSKIEFRNVSYKYESNAEMTIKNISFIIDSKEKIAIVGLNGSGKTTLLLLIMGVLDPMQGEIYVNDKNLQDIPKIQYIKTISYMMQNPILLPLKISELINSNDDYLIELLKDFNLYGKINEFVCKDKNARFLSNFDNGLSLSKGEIQKLFICLGLSKKGSLIILDEPELSVGHSYINEIIVPKLIDLSKLGKKVILSTHDANIAVRTLPLQSIYREYREGKYFTYVGSTFTDSLNNIKDDSDVYSWTNKSISTLEGGELAFLERGEIYGK